MRKWTVLILASSALIYAACSPPEVGDASAGNAAERAETAPPVPTWNFDEGMIYPTDRSLLRPEDGEVLPDGRLIVADQQHGLRIFDSDGSHRPFGDFAAAGYEHDPPTIVGGPNGVTIEPSGSHLLVSDVYRGGLYRVEIATEATELIYQHEFGINTARRDRRGGIWFSQSTQNRPEHGEEELFASVGVPNADGALFYIAPADEGAALAAVRIAEGFLFTNGLVLDEAREALYVSETMGSKIHRFDVDVEAGTVSGQTTAVEVGHPDNIEMDRYGRIWIASAVKSEIMVFDPETGEIESAFRVSTPESEAQIEAIEARLHDGVNWLDLFTPPLFAPAPGVVTGLILSADGERAMYATGLGDAIIDLSS